MRYVNLVDYCTMYFNSRYYDDVDDDQQVVKPYLTGAYPDHMNYKIYSLTKYDDSYYGDMEYLEELMLGICIRYMQ